MGAPQELLLTDVAPNLVAPRTLGVSSKTLKQKVGVNFRLQ
jgi:hypothetical protein